MSNIERRFLAALFSFAFLAVSLRAVSAVVDLFKDDVTALLAFPLTVILPAVAFVYIGLMRDLVSQEGVLMQIGVLIQLILILALPGFALYLALGFPVVFLVVELFETKAPPRLRQVIKRRVLA
ncbi:hypothetical protein OAH97_01355 [Octadecabacter sp.]|nr:hypothetical protein [Octadecabacter sp.]